MLGRVLHILILVSLLATPSWANRHGSTSGPPIDREDFILELEVGDALTVPSIEDGRPPLGLQVVLRDDHYADVAFNNELARADYTPDRVIFNTDVGPITVIIDNRPGLQPDRIEVIAPPGFYAIPSEIFVPDREVGIIEIHQHLLG